MNDTLTDKIKWWAMDRDLHVSDYTKQFMKLSEEIGELSQAINKNKTPDEISEELGDVYVVLTILSMQLGLDVRECINQAYNKIADRKGKMVNGVFVKSEDL